MSTRQKRGFLQCAAPIVAPCVVTCMSMVACASAAPFHPDPSGAGRSDRVAAICRNVMGLEPSEPLVWGIHTGVPDLDTWTSHYRGCVFSLSSSLARIDAQQAAHQAEQQCRSEGLEPGSPELAVCVLQSTRRTPNPTAASATAAGAGPPDRGLAAVKTASGSFYSASTRELSRREELACAELGLEPSSGAFESCVRNLKATFFAIDNPVN
jgi:hypothetical protein